jgi:DNA-binding NarL/FixJ family response regulator
MMLADGLLNKQIAAELDVSEATIKAHVTAIFRKMDVRSRTQAAVAARRLEQAARLTSS